MCVHFVSLSSLSLSSGVGVSSLETMLAHLFSQLMVISVQIILLLLFILLVFKVSLCVMHMLSGLFKDHTVWGGGHVTKTLLIII